MDSFGFDLGRLALETMALSESKGVVPNSIHHCSLESESNPLQDSYVFPPTTSGLIFCLEKGRGTFCVRGHSVVNLYQSYQHLVSGDSELRSLLRLEDDFELDVPGKENSLNIPALKAKTKEMSKKDMLLNHANSMLRSGHLRNIYWFETPNLFLAEIIKDQMVNRRFPYCEDMVCNISDPGFSWWFDYSSLHIQVYFKSHGIDRSERLFSLGPMGDRKIAHLRLSELTQLLNSFMIIEDLQISEKGLRINIKDEHESKMHLRSWVDYFLSGQMPMMAANLEVMDDPLWYYLTELSILRNFWCFLENETLKERDEHRQYFSKRPL